MKELIKDTEYKQLIDRIWNIYNKAKKKIVSAVNVEMLNSYWEIGRDIVEFEQKGRD